MAIKQKMEEKKAIREKEMQKVIDTLDEAERIRGKKKNYRDVITKMDPKQLAIFLCMSQDPEGWQDDKEHIQEVYDFLTTPIEKSASEYNDYYSELAEQYLGG